MFICFAFLINVYKLLYNNFRHLCIIYNMSALWTLIMVYLIVLNLRITQSLHQPDAFRIAYYLNCRITQYLQI